MAKTYGTKSPQLVNEVVGQIADGITYYDKRGYVFSEQWFDLIPSRLVNKYFMTCGEALNWCLANIPNILSARTIMRTGTSINTCSGSPFIYDTGAEWRGNTGGWYYVAFGVWDLFWESDKRDVNQTGQGIGNDLTHGFNAADFCRYKKPGTATLVGSVESDGSWDTVFCNAIDHPPHNQFIDGQWVASVYGLKWVATCQALISVGNVEDWFYEQMPACQMPAPSPSGPGGGSFIIPRPSPEAQVPAQENANTPPLDSLIKLSNHTFQFTNNFGRLNK